MPSRATRAAGTRQGTCASCTSGAITGITSGWDTKRQRLEPDAEQSARPVLRGALDSNVVAPTRLRLRTQPFGSHHARGQGSSEEAPARAVEDCREGQVPCLCQLGDLR